jgi:hypothetical protein
MLHDRRGEHEDALRDFNRALEVAPGFEEARRSRAVLLARRGDFAAARADMNLSLGQDPAGATLYAAACVAALEAKRAAGAARQRAVQEALVFLREAFRRGYGRDRAERDADLEGVRDDAGFRSLLATPIDSENK